MSNEEIAYLSIHNELLSSRQLLELRERCSGYVPMADLDTESLKSLGLNSKQAAAVQASKRQLKSTLRIMKDKAISLILYGDEGYPQSLYEMSDPPAALYVRGRMADEPRVSIVGSRKYSAYGKEIALEIGEVAARLNMGVVSGLALGIDGFAHQGCLKGQGRTIGVLACGVDRIYPVSHSNLAYQILERDGGMVSEFPLGTPSYPYNFLHRNRIIAALSQVTIMIEGEMRSGALVTAKAALDAGREVKVVLGDLTRSSTAGPYSLYREGAAVYTEPEDLASWYGLTWPKSKRVVELDSTEQRILSQLTGVTLEQVAEALQLDIAQVSSKVIMLELKGAVRHQGAGIYRRIT